MSLLSLSYEALKERRLRSTLTILMVIMGGSLLVAVNGLSTGTVSYVNNQFSTLGANLLIVSPRGQDIEIDDSLVDEIAQIQGVTDVIPFIQQISVISSRGETQSIIVMGLDQSKLYLVFPAISIDEGDFVQPSDKIGILMGNQIVYSSEETEPFTSVSQIIRIVFAETEQGRQVYHEKSFNVKGILKYLGGGILPMDQMAFISLSAAKSFFGRQDVYDGIYVITSDPSLNNRVRDRLQEAYNVNVLSPKSIADAIQRISSAISLFVDNISAVSLLVASVGIITTLWTSMIERIREIGILKAIGFSNGKIMRIFLNEAIIIGVVGGTLGLIFGVGLAYVLKALIRGQFMGFELLPVFTPENFMSTWLLCLLLSVVSGFYPAWRASQLDPVTSLRHE